LEPDCHYAQKHARSALGLGCDETTRRLVVEEIHQAVSKRHFSGGWRAANSGFRLGGRQWASHARLRQPTATSAAPISREEAPWQLPVASPMSATASFRPTNSDPPIQSQICILNTSSFLLVSTHKIQSSCSANKSPFLSP
jgi:hypothetical protein